MFLIILYGMSSQPVINYNPAKEKGLGCSLFERYVILLESSGYWNSFMMLTTQYRMV